VASAGSPRDGIGAEQVVILLPGERSERVVIGVVVEGPKQHLGRAPASRVNRDPTMHEPNRDPIVGKHIEVSEGVLEASPKQFEAPPRRCERVLNRDGGDKRIDSGDELICSFVLQPWPFRRR
jgi:hypothetical protein